MKTLNNKHPEFDNDHQTFLNRKLLIIPALLFILLATLSGCSPQRRLECLVAHHPELQVTDTLLIRDTLIRPAVVADTALPLINLTDTVVISRDRFEIKLVRVHDTIHVRGKCKADTIIRELRIPVEKIKLIPSNPKGDIISKLLWVILSLVSIVILWKMVIAVRS